MRTLAERLTGGCAAKLNGCWQWMMYKNKAGYGALLVSGKKREAYRVAYETFIGPVPAGLELDHLCRNRACINPMHLEPVTRRENVLRGDSPCARHARQTHCKNGHEFTDANTYTHGGTRRKCRICTNASVARYVARRKASRSVTA